MLRFTGVVYLFRRVLHPMIAMMMHETKPIYGIQYHPEVRNTEFGNDILSNFVEHICKMEKNWSIPKFIEEKEREIKALVGDG